MRTSRSHHSVLLSLALLAATASSSLADPTAAKPVPTIAADDLALVRKAEAARVAAIEKVYGSVVAIYGNDRGGGGSGVLFDPAGYALTNHHVVAAAGDEGWAGLADGKLYRWKLYGTDPGGDVAIIKLQGKDDFPVAAVGDSETVRVGDWAMAMGNPFVLAEDQRPTVTLGIVSGIHRYQPGEGGANTLVYGNCIQVDSSINPGNSGGPLFNLRGEVIGINGRGSFEERGRVNVGLGYAISANQVRNFIPDLLATRVVQHGTLDAQFGNRTGGVICQTINLNSPAARAGLELGARLIAFEGVEIHTANQFTNLITTFPADWPCEITFEHQGVRKTIHVRLTPLPYDLAKPQPMPRVPMPRPERPMPKEGEKEEPPKPEEGKPDEPKPEEKPAEKPAESPKPEEGKPGEPKPEGKPEPVKIVPQGPPLEPGKVRFPDRNAEAVTWLLKQFHTAPANQKDFVVIATERHSLDDKEQGTSQTTLAADGRFAITRTPADGKVTRYGFDGTKFWQREGEAAAEELKFEKAVREPLVLQAIALGASLRTSAADACGKLHLQGGDKAAGHVAYRLALAPVEQDNAYLWLRSVERGGEKPVLVKSGLGLDDEEPIPALLYSDWSDVEGFSWPQHKTQVRGLAEIPGERIRTEKVEIAATPSDNPFQMPAP